MDTHGKNLYTRHSSITLCGRSWQKSLYTSLIYHITWTLMAKIFIHVNHLSHNVDAHGKNLYTRRSSITLCGCSWQKSLYTSLIYNIMWTLMAKIFIHVTHLSHYVDAHGKNLYTRHSSITLCGRSWQKSLYTSIIYHIMWTLMAKIFIHVTHL